VCADFTESLHGRGRYAGLMLETPPSLVLFDADGVLVDSERPSTRVLAECVSELGRPTTVDEVVEHLMGVHLDDMTRIVAEWTGRDVPGGWLDGFRERRREVFETEIRPVPGVERVLDLLDEHSIPYCCCTNGPVEKVTQTLRVAGLTDRFTDTGGQPRLYSAYEVGIFKPDPGLYLHASEARGVEPARCAVIEDTRQGATAGVRAGMTTFGFTDLAPASWFEAIGAVPFSSMDELVPLLGFTDRGSTLAS